VDICADDTVEAIVLRNGRAGRDPDEGTGVEVEEEESGKGDVKRRRFAVNLR